MSQVHTVEARVVHYLNIGLKYPMKSSAEKTHYPLTTAHSATHTSQYISKACTSRGLTPELCSYNVCLP